MHKFEFLVLLERGDKGWSKSMNPDQWEAEHDGCPWIPVCLKCTECQRPSSGPWLETYRIKNPFCKCNDPIWDRPLWCLQSQRILKQQLAVRAWLATLQCSTITKVMFFWRNALCSPDLEEFQLTKFSQVEVHNIFLSQKIYKEKITISSVDRNNQILNQKALNTEIIR